MLDDEEEEEETMPARGCKLARHRPVPSRAMPFRRGSRLLLRDALGLFDDEQERLRVLATEAPHIHLRSG